MPVLTKNLNKNKDSKKVSNYIIAFISFAFIILFAMLKSGMEVDLANVNLFSLIILFLVGMVAAATMVIPGISGSFVLMLLGYYEPIVNTIRSLTNFSLFSHNVVVLGVFGLGVLIGIVLISKLIEWLFKKYETKTYYAVFGFVLASCIAIIKPLFSLHLQVLEFIIGILLFLVGMFASYKISKK